MIKSILFTKEIDKGWLIGQLGSDVFIETIPSLHISLTDQQEINSQLNPNSKQFLITSQNSVQAIKGLQLEGDFYVVGKKTAQKLRDVGFNVVLEKDYAQELADEILKREVGKEWNFFCGNTRRDVLVDVLSCHGHHLNEIITYQSQPIENKMSQVFDAYVFFSPLSFQAFVKNNQIPSESIIFTVGKTTTHAVEQVYKHHTIITANIPLVEVVVNQIKDSINDKK